MHPHPQAAQILVNTDDLPIRHHTLHKGKVRALYHLSLEDSARLIQSRGYNVLPTQPLGVMITSDRLSAFDCNWHGEGDLYGVPNKGASLNAIADHLFQRLQTAEIADHHILESPHPLVWIVSVAHPLRFEGILRRYITGSLWRAYSQGQRHLYGLDLPDGLQADQPLHELLFTPSTKGTLHNLDGIDETEDAPIQPQQIRTHYQAFGLPSPETLDHVQDLLQQAFLCIEEAYREIGQILVDTKFEIGTRFDPAQGHALLLMDEIGTPDSSRIWDLAAYQRGEIFDYCKEHFRQTLLHHLDRDLLLDPARLSERKAYAKQHPLPAAWLLDVGQRYKALAEKLTGRPLAPIDNARAEILECLAEMDLLLHPPRTEKDC